MRFMEAVNKISTCHFHGLLSSLQPYVSDAYRGAGEMLL